MPTEIAVALICISLLALLLSLYCFIFMAPLKRFLNSINSLGGGLKGMQAHMAEVEADVKARLTGLEETSQQKIGEAHEAVQASVDKLENHVGEAGREREKLRKDMQSLQAELRETAGDSRKVAHAVEALTERLRQMRDDIDGLDTELRESVRQLVSSSYSTVESTVLSALEAVQEEILYTVPADPGGAPKPSQPRKSNSRPAPALNGGPKENIISFEPLFKELSEPEGEDEESTDEGEGGAEEDGDEEGEGGG
jgi:hypothetical protein